MVELVLFFECILEQCLEKNRERAAAYCKLLRCGDTGDTASRVGFAQPARFFCAVFGEEGKMALEIRDPADSRHHSNLLSGKSHGLQIRAAFVYNLHVGKVRPSSTGWSERTKFWFHSESPEEVLQFRRCLAVMASVFRSCLAL